MQSIDCIIYSVEKSSNDNKVFTNKDEHGIICNVYYWKRQITNQIMKLIMKKSNPVRHLLRLHQILQLTK